MRVENQQQVEWKYSPISLKGTKALVTGGTTGIGRSIAILLAREGASVLIYGRNEDALNDALQDIKATGAEAFGMIADQSSIPDIEKVYQEVDRSLGDLDILVNNAAIGEVNTLDSSVEEIKNMVDVNLFGYIQCCYHAIQRMQKRGRGHIVNIGSMSASVREPTGDVYSATKAGIEAYSEALRKRVNEFGIKVSLIEPGEVGSELGTQSVEDQRKGIADLSTLASEDIAECVKYCLTQPERCDVVQVMLRPHKQLI